MYLNPANETVRQRQAIEVAIVKRVVADALAAGYTLSVDDGEETIECGASCKAAIDALMNTDEDRLYLYRAGETGWDGWVRFVYGNDGWDVISDYTVNLEDLLAGANALAEQLEARA